MKWTAQNRKCCPWMPWVPSFHIFGSHTAIKQTPSGVRKALKIMFGMFTSFSLVRMKLSGRWSYQGWSGDNTYWLDLFQSPRPFRENWVSLGTLRRAALPQSVTSDGPNSWPLGGWPPGLTSEAGVNTHWGAILMRTMSTLPLSVNPGQAATDRIRKSHPSCKEWEKQALGHLEAASGTLPLAHTSQGSSHPPHEDWCPPRLGPVPNIMRSVNSHLLGWLVEKHTPQGTICIISTFWVFPLFIHFPPSLQMWKFPFDLILNPIWLNNETEGILRKVKVIKNF